MDYHKSTRMLKALGHPARIRMVEGIDKYGCHVTKMVERLKMPQSTVSQHLSALRSAGIVTFEKKGARCCYRLVDKKIMTIITILKELA